MAVLSAATTRPPIAFALVGVAVAGFLANRSVAVPLALAGIPSLVAAVVGSNPLPKGGAPLIIGTWILLAAALTVMRGEHELPKRALASAPVALALLLLGLMLLRLGASPDAAYGSTKVQLYVANNLVFLIGGVFVGTDRRSLRVFLVLTVIVVAAGAFLLLGKLVGGVAQQGYNGSDRFALTAQEGAINLGRTNADGALIAIALILTAPRVSLRLGAIAVLPVLLVALLASGSRGPTLGFLLGLATLVVLAGTSGRARQRLLLAGGAVAVAGFLVPVVLPSSSIGRALSTLAGGSTGLSSNGRSDTWTLAFNAFSSHPLTGIGTGGFGSLSPELYPHNLVLEMAAELGIAGAAAVVALVGSLLRRLALTWRTAVGVERMEAALLIALLVSALVNAMVSDAVQDNYEIWLWGGLGLGAYTRVRAMHGARARQRVRPLEAPAPG